ncbi:MAG: hypothetical protein ACPG1A_17655, partial [Halioglobus sp.]
LQPKRARSESTTPGLALGKLYTRLKKNTQAAVGEYAMVPTNSTPSTHAVEGHSSVEPVGVFVRCA